MAKVGGPLVNWTAIEVGRTRTKILKCNKKKYAIILQPIDGSDERTTMFLKKFFEYKSYKCFYRDFIRDKRSKLSDSTKYTYESIAEALALQRPYVAKILGPIRKDFFNYNDTLDGYYANPPSQRKQFKYHGQSAEFRVESIAKLNEYFQLTDNESEFISAVYEANVTRSDEEWRQKVACIDVLRRGYMIAANLEKKPESDLPRKRTLDEAKSKSVQELLDTQEYFLTPSYMLANTIIDGHDYKVAEARNQVALQLQESHAVAKEAIDHLIKLNRYRIDEDGRVRNISEDKYDDKNVNAKTMWASPEDGPIYAAGLNASRSYTYKFLEKSNPKNSLKKTYILNMPDDLYEQMKFQFASLLDKYKDLSKKSDRDKGKKSTRIVNLDVFDLK